ncbi:MAG: ATP-dependent zinc metalloprotease FtsH [Bacillota bacterium]|nr:ATP-dependent zinc metalloprotease FtsH [Bacillota bacterium]
MLFVTSLMWMFLSNQTVKEEIVYSDLIKDIQSQKIVKLAITDTQAEATYSQKLDNGKNKVVVYTIPSKELLYEQTGHEMDAQVSAGKLTVTYPAESSLMAWISLLSPFFFIIIIAVVWIAIMKNTQGGGGAMNFGKIKTKTVSPDSKKVTFADVAGVEEEKEELTEIVEFLKNPKKYTSLGARIPKGVLLVGPPGTGKTLLAKAVAGEASAPFFSISGSDFVEMFVGVGASRVRDLFEQAKKNQPSIIFIDEIDAVGRHRGAGLGGGHDEREQTLNQLLVEMDGFGINEGIIVLAATNRSDILDPALMRPGRFDRQVYVGYPDQKAREAILKVHAKNKPLSQTVDLSVVAKTTYGFTGADLENLLNEAALLAARKNLKEITPENLDEAMLKVVMGPEKKSKEVREKDKKQTAYHEAGHAIVTAQLETQDKVHQVSIIPRGRAGGFTMSLPDTDKAYISRKEMEEQIVMLMAGRVAEEIIFGEINTGASNDIQRATEVANKMVTKYGMSKKLGSRTFGSNEEIFIGRDYGHTRDYSDATASQIDEEVNRIIQEAYDRCKQIVQNSMDKLEAVAKALIEKEKLDGDEFLAVFNGEKIPEETKKDNDVPSGEPEPTE